LLNNKFLCRPIIDNKKLNKNENDFLSCTLPKNIPSGFYTITILLTSGMAKKFESVHGYTANGKTSYEL